MSLRLVFQRFRSFSTSSTRPSYVGATPIPLPPNIFLSRQQDSILVKGPLGSTSVPVPSYINFDLPKSLATGAAGGSTSTAGDAPTTADKKLRIKRNMPCPPTATSAPFTISTPDTPSQHPPEMSLYIDDPSQKDQRQIWGLTRTLIQNAIIGQTIGFTLPVYLIGVGFRAALEPDPRILPDNHKDVIASGGPGEKRMRLAMKLGFSHTVYVVVPKELKVTVPIPTIISISGTDKATVGQFAADIRMWRPPEPYKGKGVFVGDEKIKMKSGKKK